MPSLPSIPEYYRRFIDDRVDLNENPKQCCPFHSEDTPSFSYNADRGVWRCFGACKFGGDVIALHQKNFGLHNRQEAEKSLKAIYGIYEEESSRVITASEILQVDESKVALDSLYQDCLILANSPDKWVELDYAMSKTPVDSADLYRLVMKWRSSNETKN